VSKQPVRTHCRNGHEYTPENTRRTKNGFRACRVCARKGSRNYKKKLSAENYRRQKRAMWYLRFDHMPRHYCPAKHETAGRCELSYPHGGLHAARDDERDVVVTWDEKVRLLERSA
jgi:hypothetical protein